MTIESDKQNKTCPYCYKEVKNLGLHIINNHPTIINKLEEDENPVYSPPAEKTTSLPINITSRNISPVGDINYMVREKLETMLNIKLIQMLEKGATIEEIQRISNPPPPPTNSGLDDIKKLVEIQKLITPHAPTISGELVGENAPFDWGGLISAALPMIMQMLANRNNKNLESVKNEYDTGSIEAGSIATIKPFSDEVAGDTKQPINIGEQSKSNGGNAEFNYKEVERINSGLE